MKDGQLHMLKAVKGSQNIKKKPSLSTLISLINVEPTLTDFEEFPPPQKKSPLHVY